MITFAVRPVKIGEQLFIDNGMMKKHFQCKCSKCIPKWQQAVRNRMQSEPDFKDFKQIDSGKVTDSGKRSTLKAKMVNFLTRYGKSSWSPEIEEAVLYFNNFMRTEFSI